MRARLRQVIAFGSLVLGAAAACTELKEPGNGASRSDAGPSAVGDADTGSEVRGDSGADGAVTPTQTSVAALAAGWLHTCALRSDTKGECWGVGDAGQLGAGQGNASSSPVLVNNLTNVSALASGYAFTCALVTNGSVMCWGDGAYGQLGRPLDEATTPVDVPDLSGVQAIAAGYRHACALLTSGAVHCWGDNGKGQLGNGTTSPAPGPVLALASGAVAIGAGQEHSCAVMQNGGVKCWGRGTSGQLGQTIMATQSSPVDVENLSGAKAVVGGDSHTCVLVADGHVRCFGYNASGQLGNGTTSAGTATPTEVTGLTNVVQVSAVALHTCARTNVGAVYCWGRNDEGRLGIGALSDGGFADARVPVRVLAPAGATGDLAPMTSVTAGAYHSCASNGAATYCWGAAGLLGTGDDKGSAVPVEVVALP